MYAVVIVPRKTEKRTVSGTSTRIII